MLQTLLQRAGRFWWLSVVHGSPSQTELNVHSFDRDANVLKCGAGHQTGRPCCSHGTDRSSQTIGATVPGAAIWFSIAHVHSQNPSDMPTVLTGTRVRLCPVFAFKSCTLRRLSWRERLFSHTTVTHKHSSGSTAGAIHQRTKTSCNTTECVQRHKLITCLYVRVWVFVCFYKHRDRKAKFSLCVYFIIHYIIILFKSEHFTVEPILPISSICKHFYAL